MAKISKKGLMPILKTSGGSVLGAKGARIVGTMIVDKIDNDMVQNVVLGVAFLGSSYMAVKSKNDVIKAAAISASGMFGEILIDSLTAKITGMDDDGLGELHDEVQNALNGIDNPEIQGNQPIIQGNEPNISYVADDISGYNDMDEIFGTDWDD